MNLSLSDVKTFSEWMNSAGKKDLSGIIWYFYEKSTEDKRLALSGSRISFSCGNWPPI